MNKKILNSSFILNEADQASTIQDLHVQPGQHRGSISAYQPAAPGSNLSTPHLLTIEILSLAKMDGKRPPPPPPLPPKKTTTL